MEKLYFPSDLLESRDLPSFNTTTFTQQTGPNQTRIDKRRLKTIFSHFGDKPARFTARS
jgi:hypothetical protein